MRSYLPLLLAGLTVLSAASACRAAEPIAVQTAPLTVEGNPWLESVVTPYTRDHREETYKVYTHLLDFDGLGPLTKGAGGKYTHHRGLFIGWKDTLVDGRDYDTWHMKNCYQQMTELVHNEDGSQTMKIEWRSWRGEPFIEEVRTLTVSSGPHNTRIVDFHSTLTSLAGDIELKGDLQHAGMQVRMANEVVDHEETTEYLLPANARETDDDEVLGAWWVHGSFDVNDARWDVLHMTAPDHPTGEPIYSIRDYGRFGAFFETTLTEAEPLSLHFRVAWTPDRLSPEACEHLYALYVAERE